MILLMNVDKDNPSVAEGESVQIQGAGLTGFELNGNTHQDSYTGKNLLDINSLIPNTKTSQQINGSTLTLTGTGTWSRTQKTLTLKANTSYTLMGWVKGTNGCNAGLLVTNSSQSYQPRIFNSLGQRVFLTLNFDTSVFTELTIQLYSNWSGTTANTTAVFEKVMLLEGTYTTEQDYEPYVGSTSDNITPSPSPDYPQQIEVVTGDNTINVHGKNLAKVTNTDIGDSTYSFKISNGLINITTTGSNNSFDLCGGIRTGTWLPTSYDLANDYHLTPANQSTYTLSVSNISATITGTANQTLNIFTNQRRIYKAINFNGTIEDTTFTLQQDEYVKSIYVWANGSTTINKLEFKIQLEENPTATDYQSYQSKDYEINLGDIELCKIVDYQDYIYKENNKWYKHSEIGKVVLDGSEDWRASTTNENYSSFFFTKDDMMINKSLFSNYFSQVSIPTLTNATGVGIAPHNTLTRIYFGIETSTASTRSAFLTWLSTHNTIVYYVLATPTNTEITDTDLIEQLEAISNSALFDGVNYIDLNSDNLIGSYKITYSTWYEFDKILRNGYNIREDRDRITQKFANGHRKQFVSDYVDCSITLNLDTIDKDTTQDYLQRLKSGAYKYYSIDGKEYRTAQFIIENKPELSVESSISNNVDVNEYQITLLKAGD